MTKENVISTLRSLTDESFLKYKAHIRGIFGSVARGDDSESSDIDVFVDFTENADLFDFVGLALFLEEKLHRRVDVVPRDTIKSEIRNDVMKDAIYI
ncbi:MAG: nucleotidyltransferase family protein [Nitrospirae bacterium]|nr:nucleotidyltransferase family protein [Nitrospirota bacterium]MBF0536156.1 nucleotidyltransferase family protein [Nitrospirota bacterium]